MLEALNDYLLALRFVLEGGGPADLGLAMRVAALCAEPERRAETKAIVDRGARSRARALEWRARSGGRGCSDGRRDRGGDRGPDARHPQRRRLRPPRQRPARDRRRDPARRRARRGRGRGRAARRRRGVGPRPPDEQDDRLEEPPDEQRATHDGAARRASPLRKTRSTSSFGWRCPMTATGAPMPVTTTQMQVPEPAGSNQDRVTSPARGGERVHSQPEWARGASFDRHRRRRASKAVSPSCPRSAAGAQAMPTASPFSSHAPRPPSGTYAS